MTKYKLAFLSIPIIMSLTTIGCSKKEEPSEPINNSVTEKNNTEEVSIERLKINTIKNMYKEELKTHKGNQILYQYSTKELKTLLDKDTNSLGESCVIDHNILMQSQDPDYENARFEFSLDDLNLIKVDIDGKEPVLFDLECNNGICKVKDVFINNQSLNVNIETCTENNNIKQNQDDKLSLENKALPPPKLKYELYKESQTINGTTIYKTFIKILSMEDNMKVNDLSINRGRCSYEHFWGKSTVNYGQSVTYNIHCPIENILEIEIKLADGRSAIVQL